MLLPEAITEMSPLHNFMLQDILGSIVAVLGFVVVLYAPGYVLAFASNLFGFRQMGLKDRSKWAVACSFMVAPVAAYFVGRAAGLTGVCWVFVGSAIGTVILIWRGAVGPQTEIRDRRLAGMIATGWIAFVLLMLVDFQIGHKLYFSVVVADQSYRIAFTDAVVRTGIPPANPLYFSGSASPMHYYYFWYVLCAAVVKIAQVSTRQAFIASSIWGGFGLLVTVNLFCHHFFRWQRRQRLIAMGLLVVTGADLLPALGNAVLQSTWNGDIEWWSVDPIDAWPDSLLWVPHHTASAICCLLAMLFLWRTLEGLKGSGRFVAIAFAASAFASAFGLSVYVAFGFGLLMVGWLGYLLGRREPYSTDLRWRILAFFLLSGVLSVPFGRELSHNLPQSAGGTNPAAAKHLFTLSVRRIIDPTLVTGLPVFAAWNRSHPVLLDQAMRVLLLLPGLAMELGVYGVVLVLLLVARRRRPTLQDAARDTALFFAVLGLILTVFVSSAVITNNDFGYRAVMLPQFFLLLLAADVLGSWSAPHYSPLIVPACGTRRLLYSLVGLGLAGTVYGAVLLRVWLPIEATKTQDGFSQLPTDAFSIRAAFATLDRVAPRDAVVSFRPLDPPLDRHGLVITPDEFYQRLLVMDTGRQILNAEAKCALQFGGDSSVCPTIKSETRDLFALPAPSAASAIDYCRQFGVQYLVSSSHDENAASSTGWPATLPVVAQEPGFRIVQCGGRTGPQGMQGR